MIDKLPKPMDVVPFKTDVTSLDSGSLSNKLLELASYSAYIQAGVLPALQHNLEKAEAIHKKSYTSALKAAKGPVASQKAEAEEHALPAYEEVLLCRKLVNQATGYMHGYDKMYNALSRELTRRVETRGNY